MGDTWMLKKIVYRIQCLSRAHRAKKYRSNFWEKKRFLEFIMLILDDILLIFPTYPVSFKMSQYPFSLIIRDYPGVTGIKIPSMAINGIDRDKLIPARWRGTTSKPFTRHITSRSNRVTSFSRRKPHARFLSSCSTWQHADVIPVPVVNGGWLLMLLEVQLRGVRDYLGYFSVKAKLLVKINVIQHKSGIVQVLVTLQLAIS